MAKNIGEALSLLRNIGEIDIINMNMDNTNDVTSHINHKYREEIILPYVGISNNLDFLMCKGERNVVTADGFTCKVVECEEKHICELESKIRELYGMDCWSFIKRWYSVKNTMDSFHFVVLKLQKL